MEAASRGRAAGRGARPKIAFRAACALAAAAWGFAVARAAAQTPAPSQAQAQPQAQAQAEPQAQAQPQGQPQPLEPSAFARELASRKEPLPLDDLVEAALVLSGASGEALAQALRRADELIRDVRAVASDEADPRVRGNAVLVFLHERLLRTYQEEQTRVDVALQSGRYDCVSSAVLYTILARAVGLPVVGVRTRDHAFCAVRIEGSLVDVETTNVYGFDPGEKHEFQNQFGRVTGFTYVPANRDPSRVEIDERALLSLIPQNLASLATQRRQFEAAVAPAIDGYALGRDGDSRLKLVITVSNMASSLASADRFDDALALLDRAAARYGADPRFSRLRKDMVHNQVAVLLRGGEIDRAVRLADARRASGELGGQEWLDLMVSATQMRALSVARERGFLQALDLLQEAIGRLGNDARLIESERVYRHNFEVETHNAMVVAWNAGRLDEARAIVERGLQRLPESARLRADLSTVNRALEQKGTGAQGR
jgi:tetratricopeptide (TPR) repeat protein